MEFIVGRKGEKMKKKSWMAVFVALILVCGFFGVTRYSYAEGEQTQEEKELANLGTRLERVHKTMHYGTTGAALRAVQLAASLLDWSCRATVSKETVESYVDAWFTGYSLYEQTVIRRQFTEVDAAWDILMGKSAKAYMLEAGVFGTLYPWNEPAIYRMDKIIDPILGNAREYSVYEMPDSDEWALRSILEDMRGKLEPGKKGAGLLAVQVAAELLNWSTETGMEPEGIFQLVSDWYGAFSAEEQEQIRLQMTAVDDGWYQLLHSGGKALLIDTGVSAKYYPWTDAAMIPIDKVVDAVLGNEREYSVYP